MRITWLGHSCFRLESGGSSLVIDPYSDGAVPGLAPLRAMADAVCCSHDHRDHGASDRIERTGRPCTLTVETISCFHDDKLGLLRGKNRIHIVSDGEVRAAHLGDLGHKPNKAALEKLRGVDALLIPVGGYYTIDAETAAQVCEMIGARVVIPMHYRLGTMGYDVITELSAFTKLRADVVAYDTNTFDLSPQTPAQTAVLTVDAANRIGQEVEP